MSKHTPIPYRIERNHAAGNVIHLAILGADNDMPCSITPMAWLRAKDEANAEFICRACNNHAKLLAALENILRGSATTGVWRDARGHECDESEPGAKLEQYDGEEQVNWLTTVAEIARAALAAATKEAP